MKLTPIKVRGRGGPSKQWRPPNSECIKKKRKAPGDGDDDGLSSNDGGSKIPKTAKQAKPLQDRLTSIEGLPTEVLENIIILSENPNLLRASLWIGMLFTHKLAMQELIIGAFGPTWDRWHSLNRDQIREIEARRIYSKQILPKDDDAGGNPEFQSGILACDWVTINDILSAQQVWYRRSGKQRFRNMNPMAWWLVRKRPDDDEADGETRKLPPDVFKEHPVVDAAGLFKQDWQNILDQFNDPCEEPDPDKLYYEAPPTDWGYWELHPRTRVPDHLLNGPWTPDRAQYLFWLVRGGAQILASHHWELTKQGYEAMLALTDEQLAQKQPNTPRATADQLTKILVFLFHRLGVFVKHWPLHLLEEKKQELDDGFWERYYLFSVAGPMLSEGIDVKLDAEKAERARSHTRAYLSADRTQPSPGQESYA